jgi:formylglycine-generating enzyme required for sulfatase activity
VQNPERGFDAMTFRTRCILLAGFLVIMSVPAAHAQSRSDATPPAKNATPKNKPRQLAAGLVKPNPKDGLKYVWIAPGTFQMGCSLGDNECGDDEKPTHTVKLSKGFWIGQTEVTVGAYKGFANKTGRTMPPAPSFNSGWGNEAMPIVKISWDDAQAYCKWAGGRLPTEAEWEYAARGGERGGRYGLLSQVSWFSRNSNQQAHEVGQKGANGFGLFDTLGNVWEWVNDWYDPSYYKNSPAQDPPGAKSGQYRVLRGGAWDIEPISVRVTARGRLLPDGGGSNVGFRCGEVVINP